MVVVVVVVVVVIVVVVVVVVVIVVVVVVKLHLQYVFMCLCSVQATDSFSHVNFTWLKDKALHRENIHSVVLFIGWLFTSTHTFSSAFIDTSIEPDFTLLTSFLVFQLGSGACGSHRSPSR